MALSYRTLYVRSTVLSSSPVTLYNHSTQLLSTFSQNNNKTNVDKNATHEPASRFCSIVYVCLVQYLYARRCCTLCWSMELSTWNCCHGKQEDGGWGDEIRTVENNPASTIIILCMVVVDRTKLFTLSNPVSSTDMNYCKQNKWGEKCSSLRYKTKFLLYCAKSLFFTTMYQSCGSTVIFTTFRAVKNHVWNH